MTPTTAPVTTSGFSFRALNAKNPFQPCSETTNIIIFNNEILHIIPRTSSKSGCFVCLDIKSSAFANLGGKPKSHEGQKNSTRCLYKWARACETRFLVVSIWFHSKAEFPSTPTSTIILHCEWIGYSIDVLTDGSNIWFFCRV